MVEQDIDPELEKICKATYHLLPLQQAIGEEFPRSNSTRV